MINWKAAFGAILVLSYLIASFVLYVTNSCAIGLLMLAIPATLGFVYAIYLCVKIVIEESK